MKKLHLCLLFSLALFTASSQKVYFVYVQTESEQPFFVKMNGRIYSSSASGYVILSRLLDSSYSFSIGFPQNKWPEQNFSVSVSKKDHGYLLKNFAEKGWGLFDLQTLAVQMAVTGKASIEEKSKTENKDVSVFTDILSKAADDPSLKERTVQPKIEEKKTEVAVQEVAKKEESKVEIIEPVVTKPLEVVEMPVAKKEESKAEAKETVNIKPVETIEQPLVKKEEPKAEAKETIIPKPVDKVEESVVKQEESKEIKEQSVQAEEIKTVTELYKTSQVKKWSESSTTEGFGLVFIDDYADGSKDTIRLFIPNPKPAVAAVKEEAKEEKKFLDISTETTKNTEEKVAEVEIVATESPAEKTVLKNNCSEVATANDFFKLRKKMAAVETDDDMVVEAKKYFKVKCFTSAQVKNVSTLFLTDEGKYKFFDAAYKYVSDIIVFSLLKAELKDEYYISRFNAMLRN